MDECILAIEDRPIEEAAKDSKDEALSAEKESKEKVEDSPTPPSQPEAHLCTSLKELGISGPNQEVRERAKEIRAELIRPPGEGGDCGAPPKFSFNQFLMNGVNGQIFDSTK